MTLAAKKIEKQKALKQFCQQVCPTSGSFL